MIDIPELIVPKKYKNHASFLHSSGQFFKLRRRNSNVELDFVTMFCIWASDNVIRRYGFDF